MKAKQGLLLGHRYRLVELLATGGMGEVWTARDEAVGRTVAVKVLREEFTGNQESLRRLRTEARNSAGLSHKNIAQMYDYGEQDGTGFLVMEFVRGEALADLLDRQPVLPPAQLLPILSDTARGLHHAHQAAVIHRDVKPGNILLETPLPGAAPGAAPGVKITDFGVSRADNQATMTATGMVMGTAQYLSPEQAIGKAATARSDMYSLGVIAYEATVGKRPFTGKSPVDIAVAHVNDPVPPLPPDTQPDLARVIIRLLSKDPEDRYATAGQLADELDRINASLAAPGSERAAASSDQVPHFVAKPDSSVAGPYAVPPLGDAAAPPLRDAAAPPLAVPPPPAYPSASTNPPASSGGGFDRLNHRDAPPVIPPRGGGRDSVSPVAPPRSAGRPVGPNISRETPPVIPPRGVAPGVAPRNAYPPAVSSRHGSPAAYPSASANRPAVESSGAQGVSGGGFDRLNHRGADAPGGGFDRLNQRGAASAGSSGGFDGRAREIPRVNQRGAGAIGGFDRPNHRAAQGWHEVVRGPATPATGQQRHQKGGAWRSQMPRYQILLLLILAAVVLYLVIHALVSNNTGTSAVVSAGNFACLVRAEGYPSG
ncbi:MAG: protein kinase [Cellulomonadaceae bacterium]|jgi:serine/threonine-protein kinase|nr:protein kinase [Cellulomonadaceae bacterium]